MIQAGLQSKACLESCAREVVSMGPQEGLHSHMHIFWQAPSSKVAGHNLERFNSSLHLHRHHKSSAMHAAATLLYVEILMASYGGDIGQDVALQGLPSQLWILADASKYEEGTSLEARLAPAGTSSSFVWRRCSAASAWPGTCSPYRTY